MLAATAVAALSAVIGGIVGQYGMMKPAIIGFFLLLALSFRWRPSLKGYTYTIVIFAAVSVALCYPQWFTEIGDFSLSRLITPVIQVIMFGMGTTMGLKDFAGVVKMPKGVFIGLVAQFTIMPLTGFALASTTGFPPEIAAGIVLIGCSPSGLASNVICYLAKGNLALSITITSISTLLAPFVTPFLMQWLAGSFIEIDAMAMMWDIFKMIIIPIGAGLIINKLFRRYAALINKVMPFVSMTGIAVSIVIITAAGRDSLMNIGLLLLLTVAAHNLCGYLLGFHAAKWLGMNERDCRTIAIEVGMQNGGLASAIAKEMGKIATVGLAPAIFGALMNVTGSVLASWWHKRPVADNTPKSNIKNFKL
jgi:BASS family bile acid:Na+ symporter